MNGELESLAVHHVAGDWKNEEAEFTSESTSFLTSNVRYSASFDYSHWYHQGGAYSGWYWDPYSGHILLDEQLSKQYGFGDKWDTIAGQAAVVAEPYYPYKSASSGAAPATDAAPLGSPSRPSSTAERGLAAISTTMGSDPDEVRVEPLLGGGLENYARTARQLASEVVRGGSAQGVLTFAHPVSALVIDRLEAMGVKFQTVEATTSPDEQGLRWTLAGLSGKDLWPAFSRSAAEEGVKVLGVTSATVTVENAALLSRVQSDPDVFLVDLSVEHVRRASGKQDVVMNDLYWKLVNWE